jgi:hypothetical protein
MLFMACVLAVLSGAAHASNLLVTSTADSGSGTLREAVNTANSNGTGNDTITFSLGSGPQTIALTSGQIAVAGDLTITGPGASQLTVQRDPGAGAARIFNISSGTVNISGITISGGQAQGANGTPGTVGQGGAIFNTGSLTLTECAFTGNYAQGGSGSGSLAVGGLGQGGAIFSTGSQLTVQRCTFSSNSATGGSGGNGAYLNNTSHGPFQPGGNAAGAQGGAIYANAASGVTISNSTFAGNFANGGTGGGSGFSNSPVNTGTGGAGGDGEGGAIYSAQGLAITSCTIAGNAANGGIGGTDAGFNNVGAGGNARGGGIVAAGTVTSGNTLVATNTANAGGGGSTGAALGPDVFGTFSSGNFNLIGILTGDATGFNGTADQKGTSGSPIDAKLDPQGAQDNGGPTKTVRLRKGSPAVDKGADLGAHAVDQRGSLRPKDLDNALYPNATGGDGSDIGAYEAQSLPNDVPVIQSSPQTVNGQVGVALSGQQVTASDGDSDPLTYSLVSGTMPDGLTLNSDGTITGTPTTPGQSAVTFKANDGLVDSNVATLNINIQEQASLVVNTDIDDSTVYDGVTSLREAVNLAINDGQTTPVTFDPAFFATAKTITLTQGTLSNFSGDLTINGPAAGVTISGGDTTGIFQFYQGPVNLTNLTIANGHTGAFGSGSALYLGNFGSAIAVKLSNCTLENNGGDDSKGAIANNGDTLTLTNCTLSGNHTDDSGQSFAYAAGAALYQSSGTTTLTNCTLSGNHANGGTGGAIQIDGGTVTLNNTIVAGNAAATGPDIAGAVVGSSISNLIGDGTAMTGISNGTNGNQVGVAASPINPLLGALGNNGGPTETMALLTGSPAIDAGSNALAPATDQRGTARPQPAGGTVDIGAYELLAATYTITGVVKTNTGVPLAGVSLAISPVPGGTTSPVTTDSTGAYTFTSVAPGTYTLTPTRSGFTIAPTSTSVRVTTANRAANFVATSTSPIYTVSGRIIDGFGAAVANLPVSITPTPAGVAASVNTNSSGYYTFTGVPAGTYTVMPTLGGTYYSPATRTANVTNANVSGLNFISYKTATLAGRVSNSSGVAIPNVSVALTLTAGGTPITGAINPVTTNSAGYFTFNKVPDGNYTITPTLSGYIFSPPSKNVTMNGATVSGQNFIGATGYSVTGRIATSSGVSIAGVTVTADSGQSAVSNSAGYYTINGVPNGTHTLTPSKSGMTFTPPTKSITVNGANISGQNFIGS